MKESTWRQRGERVLLRPIPPLLRIHEELWNRCPWYFTDGSGAHLITLDGRDYLDLEMGRGPNILGYCHPVTEAARAAFKSSTARTALFHPVEVELAEIIVDQIACAEAVLFSKNGSDACTAAVRVARTVTNREIIVSSGYHGFGDWCVADDPGVAGFPNGFKGHVASVELNDCAGLKSAFEKHSGNIAGLIVEPAHRLLPEPQFLAACKALTESEGALLIFDEVVTAFRLDIGGAQKRFGVVPDLTCLGKAMANGLPISALVGRRDLMQAIERSFFSMTFMHDNPTFAGAKACLQYLIETKALDHIAETGESLREAFDKAARSYNLEARSLGFPARMDLDFPPAGRISSAEQLTIFGAALLDYEILPTASIFACEMMTTEDVARAGEAFAHGMARVRERIDLST